MWVGEKKQNREIKGSYHEDSFIERFGEDS